MSQDQKQQSSNNTIHNYSQSDETNVSDAINLINYLVDTQQQHNQTYTFKSLTRKRSRSNSSHSIQCSKPKVKPQSSNEHIITSSPSIIHAKIDTTNHAANVNPVATNSPFDYHEHSPCSISSSMDFDNTSYINRFTEETHSDQIIDIKPKFQTKLSTVLSVGMLEMDTSNIDKEIKISETDIIEEIDTNHLIDYRTNEECKRIMFLYNSKSGGQKALTLLKYFQIYTTLIYDLFTLNSSQNEIDKLAYDLTVYENKIVICIVGGDGSQCWAVSLIHKAIKSISKPIKYPTIVPFPVGTGNDLSRSLGWGYIEKNTHKQILKHISDVEYCFNITKRFSVVDRWSINYTFPHLNNCEEKYTLDEYISNTFNPPLPKQFLCYLSIGYDAMITYNFAMERKNNPQKFKSQLSNQTVYLKMGLKEFLKPSNPVNNSIELWIDGKQCVIPDNTRSLKVININSAASGIFFWGYLKSNKNELQNWKRPQLNDGLIEIMATKGSSDLAKAKTKIGHAHRLGQSNDVVIKILKVPMYLQIDGEGYEINELCEFNIKLYDQLPTLVGYKYPRGVYHKYTAEYYNDRIKQSRHRYRNIIKMKYNVVNNYENIECKKMKSIDDFNVGMNGNGYDDEKEKEEEEIKIDDKGKERNKSMSEIMGIKNKNKKKVKKWKPLFISNDSWKRNKTKVNDKTKRKYRRMSWF